MLVIKNTLLHKAFEASEIDFEPLYDCLTGNTAVLFTNTANSPAKLLKEKEVDDCYIISGKTKVRERTSLLEMLEQLDKGFVLLSTGKYIGEGFDLPQLDTLILAAPFSWKNNLIQYAGRIHRNYKDKSLVRIFDYVDIHVPYLEKMFQKRLIFTHLIIKNIMRIGRSLKG